MKSTHWEEEGDVPSESNSKRGTFTKDLESVKKVLSWDISTLILGFGPLASRAPPFRAPSLSFSTFCSGVTWMGLFSLVLGHIWAPFLFLGKSSIFCSCGHCKVAQNLWASWWDVYMGWWTRPQCQGQPGEQMTFVRWLVFLSRNTENIP